MGRQESTLRLNHCTDSQHGQHTTFCCALSPFGLISPGTAWFINKHKTISWLNYWQEEAQRLRGRVNIWGYEDAFNLEFYMLMSQVSLSNLLSMLWVIDSPYFHDVKPSYIYIYADRPTLYIYIESFQEYTLQWVFFLKNYEHNQNYCFWPWNITWGVYLSP